MIRNNIKGMTTVELTVIISLISLMMAIIIPMLNSSIKNQKENLYNTQIENIKKGAKAWGSANVYLLPTDNGDSITISLGELKSKGFVEENIINPKTEKAFADNVLVTIVRKNDSYLYTVENADVADQSFDPDAPYIILNGRVKEYVEINGDYTEKGVKARDKDGNLITEVTTQIKKDGAIEDSILTNQIGTYVITYTVVDNGNGKSSSINRMVIVRDTLAPNITVNGVCSNQTMNVRKRTNFSNPVAVITDNSGEIITPTIMGSVDTSVEGSYELIYEAKDSSNNIQRLVLTVLVKD